MIKEQQISFFINSRNSINDKIVNVSSVPQRSPFRYPGGKTWLIPTIRRWMKQGLTPTILLEPFAGGGIVSLTAAFEKLANHIIMVEKDSEIAAVWEVIFSDKNRWFAEKILNYSLNYENVKLEIEKSDKLIGDLAFCTILKNRINHGGIIAKGSGMIKNGEKGKGLLSRWYPKTLHDRIRAIESVKDKVEFISGDAFDIIEKYIDDTEAFIFLDPPYTIAGRRLYNFYEIDHERLFSLSSKLKGNFMLTYDDTQEIRNLAKKFKLDYRTIPMQTTHLLKKNEIIISDNFNWLSKNA